MVFPTAFIMNERPTVCKGQAMDLSGYERPCGSLREDHLSLFQSSLSRVFARSSSRTFSRRSSTGGIFPFIIDLKSSECFHASVSTAAETVIESEPSSYETNPTTGCNRTPSPPSPVRFDAHRAFRRSSMPCSNAAVESVHSAGNGMPSMMLRDDMDGKVDRGVRFAADAGCADKSPPSSECWIQQIKKLRENNSTDKKTSLFYHGENALKSLQFSNKNRVETLSKNLRTPDHRKSTEHMMSKKNLTIIEAPTANYSSSPNVTTALVQKNTEPIEKEAPHQTLRVEVNQDRLDYSSEHSQIHYHPAEYARQWLGLQTNRPNQKEQWSRKTEDLFERAYVEQWKRGQALSAHHFKPTKIEGVEEENVCSTTGGFDDELSEVTVSSFECEHESVRLQHLADEDGSSQRCREEVKKLLSQILFEEQTFQRDALSLSQVRALHSLPTEKMEAILRYMEICRYENVATRWDIIAVMIGNIEQQDAAVRVDEESFASSDFGFISRSSEDDVCSIGSGFTLEANTMECDSSISCSDHDDITYDSEYYEEEEVVEEETVVSETVVSGSEDFQESCQM